MQKFGVRAGGQGNPRWVAVSPRPDQGKPGYRPDSHTPIRRMGVPSISGILPMLLDHKGNPLCAPLD